MGLSVITSLMSWDMISTATFVGLRNYLNLFTEDALFSKAITVTFLYTLFSVPLQLLVAFALAMLLNSKMRGVGAFRTIYYLPSLIPVVVSSVMWLWLYNQQYGLINTVLVEFGLDRINWLNSTEMVIPSLVIMSLWSVGNIVIIFLAGLQGIPGDLIEAAKIDGASAWKVFINVTIPFMSPVILYNLIINMIKALQLFTEPYIMTGGGPMNSSLTVVLHIYNNAFKYGKIGPANAMAWVLFILTMGLSAFIYKSSDRWTFYEGDTK